MNYKVIRYNNPHPIYYGDCEQTALKYYRDAVQSRFFKNHSIGLFKNNMLIKERKGSECNDFQMLG